MARQTVTTSVIWLCATGMLGICIPLVAVTRSGVILPLAVISGAAVGTDAVWRKSEPQSRNSPTVENSLQELKQRVANLEIICSKEELALPTKFKQLDSTPNVRSDVAGS